MEQTINKNHKKIFKEMVEFVRNLGISVHTNTKARGHQGFFLKNRIDISNELDYPRKIEVLIHEFTHYIHYKIDPTVYKTHGNLELLFPNSDIKRIEEELILVTKFVDKTKSVSNLAINKEKVLKEIENLTNKIKLQYPDFKKTYSYPKFEKIIKRTDAKYLLKYDRVKVKAFLIGKTQEYSIDNLDIDFPQFEESIKDYIALKSKQRILRRISNKTGKLNSYYKRPTELFARFVEGLFIDTQKVSQIAPHAYLVFCSELAKNRYLELADLINNFF